MTRRDPQAAGCLLAFGGMLLLTAVPALGNFVDIEPSTAYGFLTLALLLLVGGAIVSVTGVFLRTRAERRTDPSSSSTSTHDSRSS